MLQDYLNFLNDLSQNNNRDWFELHKSTYKTLHTQFQSWVGELISEIAKFDPTLKFITPKDCTYRIYRDSRFSKDKTPYKTHLSAAFSPTGKNGSSPGYYFELTPDRNIMIGGGWYYIEPEQLYKLRLTFSKNSKDFLKITENPSFLNLYGNLGGEKLKTSPKGFSVDNPNIELLKHKNYIVSFNKNTETLNDQEIADLVLDSFKTLQPFISYLRMLS